MYFVRLYPGIAVFFLVFYLNIMDTVEDFGEIAEPAIEGESRIELQGG